METCIFLQYTKRRPVRGGKLDRFISSFLHDCDQTVASCIHGFLERDCGMPIYDEYEDDYWDEMPRETIGDLAGLGLNKEKDEVVGIRASSYVLNPRTPYQGEMVFPAQPH